MGTELKVLAARPDQAVKSSRRVVGISKNRRRSTAPNRYRGKRLKHRNTGGEVSTSDAKGWRVSCGSGTEAHCKGSNPSQEAESLPTSPETNLHPEPLKLGGICQRSKCQGEHLLPDYTVAASIQHAVISSLRTLKASPSPRSPNRTGAHLHARYPRRTKKNVAG